MSIMDNRRKNKITTRTTVLKVRYAPAVSAFGTKKNSGQPDTLCRGGAHLAITTLEPRVSSYRVFVKGVGDNSTWSMGCAGAIVLELFCSHRERLVRKLPNHPARVPLLDNPTEDGVILFKGDAWGID